MRDNEYLDVVRQWADTLLEHGRDRFGPKRTPMFLDTLHVNAVDGEKQPYRWTLRDKHVKETGQPKVQILANSPGLGPEGRRRRREEPGRYAGRLRIR